MSSLKLSLRVCVVVSFLFGCDVSEPTYFDPGECAIPPCDGLCGNGRIEEGEACDDNNPFPGDGCDQCQTEGGWLCEGSPSTCNFCGGDQPGDECLCGEQQAAVCPANVCLALGHLPKPGCARECDATISADEIKASCGEPINTIAKIREAIARAEELEGHELITVHDGLYSLTEPIVMGGQPGQGYSFFPAGPTGGVFFERHGFEIVSGNHTIIGFTFIDQLSPLEISGEALPVPDRNVNNVIANNVFIATPNLVEPPASAIRVISQGNYIAANMIVDVRRDNGGGMVERWDAGISVLAPSNAVAMNLLHGSFGAAIRAELGALPVFIDNNSISLMGGSGIAFTGSGSACVRQNIIEGRTGANRSTGWQLSGAARVTLLGAVACAIGTGSRVASGNNVVTGHGQNCDGADCSALCAGNQALCDLVWPTPLSPVPQLNPQDWRASLAALGQSFCSASELAEMGDPLIGYDFLDEVPELYSGAAPPIGGLDLGVRLMGGFVIRCL